MLRFIYLIHYPFNKYQIHFQEEISLYLIYYLQKQYEVHIFFIRA